MQHAVRFRVRNFRAWMFIANTTAILIAILSAITTTGEIVVFTASSLGLLALVVRRRRT